MKKLGLALSDTSKICRTGAGGYILREKGDEYKALFARFRNEEKQAIANDKDGTGYIQEMFEYELANHEYGYTRDASDTFRALGLSMDEINANKNLLNGFTLARKSVIEWDNENN